MQYGSEERFCDGAFITISINVLFGFLWGQNGNSFQPTQEEERGYVNYESYILEVSSRAKSMSRSMSMRRSDY
ncbi:hypothetical protein TNCV_740521 [Trichonephila clavipes]|nr:hypothetical protein TNCV_740521 [Trichonephila clavipes]